MFAEGFRRLSAAFVLALCTTAGSAHGQGAPARGGEAGSADTQEIVLQVAEQKVLSATVVNLELGQSIILAGLTSKSERTSKTGLPGLSQLPLLGVLFGSHAHAESETENVVIIVPCGRPLGPVISMCSVAVMARGASERDRPARAARTSPPRGARAERSSCVLGVGGHRIVVRATEPAPVAAPASDEVVAVEQEFSVAPKAAARRFAPAKKHVPVRLE